MSQSRKSTKPENAPSLGLNKRVTAQISKSLLVGSRYQMGKPIGKGNFGVVRHGKDVINNKDVAIKTNFKGINKITDTCNDTSQIEEPMSGEKKQLPFEYHIYCVLGATESHKMIGIPRVYYYGSSGKQSNAIVLELLGPSLEELFNICGRKFSLKTILMIIIHTLNRIEMVHEKGIVYRDIKPENFVVGGKRNTVIYIIDFGLAKEYIDPNTNRHIVYKERKNLIGTARYMSINTHLGKEQSRRDDLESLGHMYMYLVRGSLPWQGLKVKSSKERFQKICSLKQSTPISSLCYGHPEMAEYMQYVRRLEFYESPNYNYLREIFKTALRKNEFEDDQLFDWSDKIEPGSNQSSN